MRRLSAAQARAIAWLDRSQTAKLLAGQVVGAANIPVGIGRSLVHTGEGLLKTYAMGQALMHPLRLDGQIAWRLQRRTAQNIVRQTQRAVADPRAAVGAAGRQLQAHAESVEPSLTPMADTFDGEMQRRATIGRNQGELAADVGSLAYGGLAVRGIAKESGAIKAFTAADHQALGRTPRQEKRLAEPYTDMGHHDPARRHTKGMPEWFRNNPFFLYKPNVTREQFYKLHFGVDPSYWGGSLPGPGPGWSGKKLGLQRFGLLDRVAVGMPGPRKAAAIGNGAIVAYPFEDLEEGHAP